MGRAPCCEKVGLKRGRWTTEEDELLTKYIQENGEGSWRSLPKNAGLLRCGKSCRLRWINYLKAGLKRGNISCEEEDLIVKLHTKFGNRWSLIASHLPGRTDNEIKNYWNSHLSRKIYSFRRATTMDTTLPGLTDTPKVPIISTPKPKSRRCGRTSRWAMKKNKFLTQKGNQKPKLQNAPQHKEEVASIPPPSIQESEVNLSSSITIKGIMVLDLDNNHNNNLVEKEEEEEEDPISNNNGNNNEHEKKEGLEVQNYPMYEKENNNEMLILGPYDDLVEDIINVDDGVLNIDDMMDTFMLEASGDLTTSQENETNNNSNSFVALSCEDQGESVSVNNSNVSPNNGEISGEWHLGDLDDCWNWESVIELNNKEDSIIDDELEGCNNNWEQRENLLAWLWEDEDLESECMKFGEMDAEEQNDWLAWFFS